MIIPKLDGFNGRVPESPKLLGGFKKKKKNWIQSILGSFNKINQMYKLPSS